ncbi:MAG TPA: hypothetical protein VF116_03230 [Ktedonobacterales bacterium]
MATDDRRRRGESPRHDYDEELLRITAEYADAARSGATPRISDYVRRYPQYARELVAYALSFSAVYADQPAPDERPATSLSPAAQKALAYIRERAAAYETASAVSPADAQGQAQSEEIESFFRRGVALGYPPARLFTELGVSADLGAKLEARMIAAATIPRTLVERLARVLQTSAEAVQAYLASTRPRAQGAQLYLAERPPEYSQQSFLDAVEHSMLPEDEKRVWVEIAQRDGVG